jgi:hypothetical protein
MRTVFRAVPVLLVLLALLSLVSIVDPRGGRTLPLYAARTGLQCANCHFDPNGGGPRNEFGFAFAKNRHAIEPETGEKPWGELNLANRVGDSFPLYFGINQRFMLLANGYQGQDSVARLGFYNMESAIHLAFQPHPKLTLVYSMDPGPEAFGGARYTSKESFGMFTGLPVNGYVKAGRFRTPFGLRWDDHTVATRNGFLDFTTAQGFLPYDPRTMDEGIEVGAERSGVFGRAAFTNGGADVFSGQYAGATTLKLGYNNARYQGALSLYDNYRKENVSGVQHSTRWGFYGMTHLKQLAVIGEAAAGTDELEPTTPGMASGDKTNLLAWELEGDYAPVRQANVRVRYDQLVTDRSTSQAARDAATHDRWAIEAEWVPVPFAELRATYRWINHKDNTAYGYPDETQSYLQFHFSY